MASGTVQVFLAEALLLPTGLLTAAYLTRQLGPDGYGLLLLATTIVTWIGWSITSAFTRTTIKLIGETEDWQAVATIVGQLHLGLGSAAVAMLWLVADPVAIAVGEPQMTNYLRLFALEIPIFCLTYAHRSVLVGLGRYGQRAVSTAARWIFRMVLSVALVWAGLSLWGAILGSLLSALIELLICSYFVHLPLFRRSTLPMQKLWSYAVPLFLLAISLRLYEKLDLLMLKLLGGTAADAGFYGTAQSLSLMPSLFTLAFVPLLLSTLTRTLYAGELETAQRLSRDGMRLVLLMLPFAALAAGASVEIIQLLFSPTFLPAAPLFSILIFAAVAMAMIAVTTCILTAIGKPNWTIALTAPMVALAVLGNLWVFPRWGAVGVASVTTIVASFTALAFVLVIYRHWQVLPPFGSLLKSLVLSVVIYVVAPVWLTTGWGVVLKLVLLSLLIGLGLFLLGEFSDREVGLIKSGVHSVTQFFSQKFRSRKGA
jgi:O-antigen/teichoic acid export membrane protein